MKVVAFNGSVRSEGNTTILLNLVLDEIRHEGIDTELIQLSGKALQGPSARLPILCRFSGIPGLSLNREIDP